MVLIIKYNCKMTREEQIIREQKVKIFFGLNHSKQYYEEFDKNNYLLYRQWSDGDWRECSYDLNNVNIFHYYNYKIENTFILMNIICK